MKGGDGRKEEWKREKKERERERERYIVILKAFFFLL